MLRPPLAPIVPSPVLGAIGDADDRESAARELSQLFSDRSVHEP